MKPAQFDERVTPIPAQRPGLWRDLGCALALLAVAAAYFALASRLGESALADVVGPAGLPLIYAAALAMLAAVIGIGALVRARKTAGPLPASGASQAHRPRVERDADGVSAVVRLRRAAGALAIGAGYVLVLPAIGYPFAIALAIAVMAVYQGERPGLRLALVACAGAAVLYALFDIVLGISMPAPWR